MTPNCSSPRFDVAEQFDHLGPSRGRRKSCVGPRAEDRHRQSVWLPDAVPERRLGDVSQLTRRIECLLLRAHRLGDRCGRHVGVSARGPDIDTDPRLARHSAGLNRTHIEDVRSRPPPGVPGQLTTRLADAHSGRAATVGSVRVVRREADGEGADAMAPDPPSGSVEPAPGSVDRCGSGPGVVVDDDTPDRTIGRARGWKRP